MTSCGQPLHSLRNYPASANRTMPSWSWLVWRTVAITNTRARTNRTSRRDRSYDGRNDVGNEPPVAARDRGPHPGGGCADQIPAHWQKGIVGRRTLHSRWPREASVGGDDRRAMSDVRMRVGARILAAYIAVATIGNLLWEAAQLPLYTIWRNGTPHEILVALIHCTGGDALIASFILA